MYVLVKWETTAN